MSNAISTTQENRPTREQRQERRGWIQPQVNIVETSNGYSLEAEMPAVGKDGLEVLLEGTELTFVGRKNAESLGAQLLYRESSDRDYRRTFELDPAIDSSRIASRN